MNMCIYISGKGKGKFRPKTDHESPEEQTYSSTLSLTSALDRGGWLTPRPGRFTPGKETRYTHSIGCWVVSRPIWTGAENLAPHLDSIPGSPSPLRVTIVTELSRPTSRWCARACACVCATDMQPAKYRCQTPATYRQCTS